MICVLLASQPKVVIAWSNQRAAAGKFKGARARRAAVTVFCCDMESSFFQVYTRVEYVCASACGAR